MQDNQDQEEALKAARKAIADAEAEVQAEASYAGTLGAHLGCRSLGVAYWVASYDVVACFQGLGPW